MRGCVSGLGIHRVGAQPWRCAPSDLCTDGQIVCTPPLCLFLSSFLHLLIQLTESLRETKGPKHPLTNGAMEVSMGLLCCLTFSLLLLLPPLVYAALCSAICMDSTHPPLSNLWICEFELFSFAHLGSSPGRTVESFLLLQVYSSFSYQQLYFWTISFP